MVEVIQADREAAAKWAKRNSRHQQAANIRRGSCDTSPIVQAFAAHRIEAERPLRIAIHELGFEIEDWDGISEETVHIHEASCNILAGTHLKGQADADA